MSFGCRCVCGPSKLYVLGCVLCPHKYSNIRHFWPCGEILIGPLEENCICVCVCVWMCWRSVSLGTVELLSTDYYLQHYHQSRPPTDSCTYISNTQSWWMATCVNSKGESQSVMFQSLTVIFFPKLDLTWTLPVIIDVITTSQNIFLCKGFIFISGFIYFFI